MPSHRSTSTTSTCQPPPSGCGARAARRRRRGRSDLLGPVAVGVGDYFHHVTVGVVEIDAATAVQMIDLAGLGAPRIGVMLDALRADAMPKIRAAFSPKILFFTSDVSREKWYWAASSSGIVKV